MKSIVIIGNMCSGKTTLCRHLAAKLGAISCLESVDDNPLLKLAYENRAKYNHLLQFYFLFRRFLDAHQFEKTDSVCVYDRYFYDGPEVFVPTHFKLGNLSSIEKDVIMLGYDALKPYVLPPNLLIYLRSDPKSAHQRLLKRGRPYELKSALQFIELLNSNYEIFFSNYAFGPKLSIDIESYSLVDTQDLIEVGQIITDKFSELSAQL